MITVNLSRYAANRTDTYPWANAACKGRDPSSIPILLLACFVLVYATHIRSYYEMESGHVDDQAALRFSMNLMGLWGIAVGLGLEVSHRVLRRLLGPLGLRQLPTYATALASVVCLAF